MLDDGTINVRYMVDDVAAAVTSTPPTLVSCCAQARPPAFADVTRGDLRLLLSGPGSSAGRPMADGERPAPGGWNRIHFLTEDLAGDVERLRGEGVAFRNDIVTGRAALRSSPSTPPAT